MSLHAIPFAEEHLFDVQEFECGNEPWAVEVAEWLKGRPGNDCSLYWMRRSTRVWLYKDDERLIGFGSLGATKWKLPPPDGPRIEVAIIPAVAVQTPFQHKPDDVPREKRYSYQIIGDLIQRARDDGKPILGLFVHNDNQKAIRFYKKVGFNLLPSTDLENQRMFLDLSID